jgi:hypothetical protein
MFHKNKLPFVDTIIIDVGAGRADGTRATTQRKHGGLHETRAVREQAAADAATATAAANAANAANAAGSASRDLLAASI